MWLHWSNFESRWPRFSETMTMITTATTSSPTFICSFHSPNHLSTKSSLYQHSQWHILKPIHNPFSSTNSLFYAKPLVSNSRTHLCFAGRRRPTVSVTPSSLKENDGNLRRVLQIGLWVAEVVYVLWLFLLPYAPVSTPFFVRLHVSVCWMCCLELICISYMSHLYWSLILPPSFQSVECILCPFFELVSRSDIRTHLMWDQSRVKDHKLLIGRNHTRCGVGI